MITWISAEKQLPKTHTDVDDEGRTYEVSNMILVWDGDEERPIGVGCYEDGKFYCDGIRQENITHWALINGPDGHLLQQEYMG